MSEDNPDFVTVTAFMTDQSHVRYQVELRQWSMQHDSYMINKLQTTMSKTTANTWTKQWANERGIEVR